MADSTCPRGLIADLITPIGPNGAVDRPGLDRILDRVLQHVQGVLLCGPDAGEGAALGQSQRLDVLLSAINRVNGCVPLIIWITCNTQEETCSMLEVLEKGVEKEGYTGQIFWLDTPLVYHSNRGLPQHLKDLASFSSRPIILFNDPERVKRVAGPLKRGNIRTAILKETALVEGVSGLIFRGALDRARNYQKAVRFRSGFPLYDGDEGQFLSHPSRHGVLSAGVNLAPAAWQRITASSLGMTDEEQRYPDHLKRIWELGRYLEALRGIYAEEPARLIREALDLAGVFEPAASPEELRREDPVHRLHDLMKQHGDA
ncbi:MAG: dihydrodipicolinate synthase family protein [Thermodesulfobacteriota bacterium]